jgi:hypothetical protein
MLAAFATLAFLTTLWLVAGAALLTLAGSGSKIAAALQGRSPLAAAPRFPAVAVRFSPRVRSPHALRAQPEWRAAA